MAASLPDPCGLIFGEDPGGFAFPAGGAGAAVVVTTTSLLSKGTRADGRDPRPPVREPRSRRGQLLELLLQVGKRLVRRLRAGQRRVGVLLDGRGDVAVLDRLRPWLGAQDRGLQRGQVRELLFQRLVLVER